MPYGGGKAPDSDRLDAIDSAAFLQKTEAAATDDGTAGADLIGATAIPGLTGTTVQALLEAVKAYAETLINGIKWQTSVKDKDLNAPPAEPTAGDRYWLASAPSGAWSGHAYDIAQYSGSAWVFTDGAEGMGAWVEDENLFYVHSGSAVVTFGSLVQAASESTAGILALATAAEINTGTEAAKAITPDGLQASKRNIRYLIWRAVAAGTSLTGSNSVALESMESPISGTIINDADLGIRPVVRNDTAGVTDTATYDVHLDGTTIFSTPLTTDTGEATSRTAAAPPVLSTTEVTAGQVFSFYCDTPHSGTAEKGATFIIPVLMS